jgi:hypothetical protein
MIDINETVARSLTRYLTLNGVPAGYITVNPNDRDYVDSNMFNVDVRVDARCSPGFVWVQS